MADQADLLPGTRDLLILKAVSLGKVHGGSLPDAWSACTLGARALRDGCR